MTMGNRLRRLREARKWRQEDVSIALRGYGIVARREHVAKWELDNNEPVPNTIGALADIFKTSTDYIIRGIPTIENLDDVERDVINAMRDKPRLLALIILAQRLGDDQINGLISIAKTAAQFSGKEAPELEKKIS